MVEPEKTDVTSTSSSESSTDSNNTEKTSASSLIPETIGKIDDDGKMNKGKLARSRRSAPGLLGKLERHQRAITALSIICCLITLVLSIIVCQAQTDSYQYSQPPLVKLPEVCVQCEQLARISFNQPEVGLLVSNLTRRTENGTEMCCAENREQMSALLQASLNEQEAVSAPELQDIAANANRVSAHKKLWPGDKRESNLTKPYFNGGKEHFPAAFRTDFNDPVTEHVSGVEVLNTTLRVNYTGLYYVYFSIHMGPEFNMSAKDFTYQSWFQYVHRESPNDPANTGILLQTAYTAHNDSINSEETVFASGTFYLIKGDKLQVCVSGLGLVRYNKESSFLGIFMLNSGSKAK